MGLEEAGLLGGHFSGGLAAWRARQGAVCCGYRVALLCPETQRGASSLPGAVSVTSPAWCLREPEPLLLSCFSISP